MEHYDAIEAAALVAALHPDDDAWLRRVQRYYSKTFHTPLHQVTELPIDDVVQAYYEDRFDAAEEEELFHIRDILLETPEERAKRLTTEGKQGDDAFFESLNAEVKQSMTEKPRQSVEPGQLRNLDKLAERVGRTRQRAEKMAGVSLPVQKPGRPRLPDPEDLAISFGDDNLGGVDFLLDDPLAPPRKKTP